MENTSKKKIIIIFIILLLFGIGFFFFFNKEKTNNLIEKGRNLFPFGKIEINPENNQSEKQESNETESQKTTEEIKETRKIEPRLRQVSNFPTGGFIPLIKIEDKEITDITINADGTKTESQKTIQLQNNYVRYASIDDATVYEAKIDPYSIKENLLIENNIPNTENIIFSPDGKNILFRYWNKIERNIETYLAKIKKIELEIEKCPYDFSKKIKIGDVGDNIFDLHEFLNKNKFTKIAKNGKNSPGNETPLAEATTITAIKNFQSLYDLDIDGELGKATQKKMLEICNKQQEKKAKEAFAKKEKKYESSGYFLPQGISSLDVNPEGNNFFTLEKDELGVIGVVRNFNNEDKKIIFESSYSDWLVQWNKNDAIQLNTRASYLSDGYLYKLNPTDGDYHKSFKQEKGLTTLASPNNEKILRSYIKEKELKTDIYRIKANRSISLINIQTFPEKCTWAKNSKKLYCMIPQNLSYKEKYPDTWYKGLENTTDALYEINPYTGKITLLSNIQNEYEKDLDISKINIDKNENYLYFIDKKTEYLWSYRLLDV